MKSNPVYENIKSLKPFFFSLREIKENVSLDIRIPLNWKYNEVIVPPVSCKVQDTNDNNTLISLISTSTKEGYDLVFSTAKKIIKTNQEEEDKFKLFNEKVEELKKLFLTSSLDKLKEITIINDGPDNSKRIGLAEEGEGEGSGKNGEK